MLWSKLCILLLSSALTCLPVLPFKKGLKEASVAVCAFPKEEVTPKTHDVKKRSSITQRVHTVAVYDENGEKVDKKKITSQNSVSSSRQRFTVLVAADEEYRQIHPDWMELTNKIVERADEPFKDDHDIDFDVEGFARWESDGSRSGEILSDLKDDWDGLGYDFVIGFTDDEEFEHGGLAYVYSNSPDGSAMSVVANRSSVDSAAHVVQHELSHNLGLNHHSSSSRTKCIMNTRYTYDVDYWDSRHDDEIEENKWWYGVKKVKADVETDEVKDSGDAAEDPAIWVHPTNASLSKVFATNKKEGIGIYDLDGREINFYDFGRINNIDVRYNFPYRGVQIDILAGSNRSRDSIDVYAISNNGTELERIGRIDTDIDVYGFSLYHSLRTGKFYAMVLGDDGEFEQYELEADGDEVEGTKVREFEFDSRAEGMVADDEYAKLYIAQEEDELWRFGAEPGDGDEGVEIDDVDNVGYLDEDLEGVTLYYGRDGTGYVILSSQGNDRYAVYDRKSNEYLGIFSIIDGDEIDGTSETDGIDVMSFGLGPKFPFGLFVAQDDENITNGEKMNQNFKFVRWEKIAQAFDFPFISHQVNPRGLMQREF